MDYRRNNNRNYLIPMFRVFLVNFKDNGTKSIASIMKMIKRKVNKKISKE